MTPTDETLARVRRLVQQQQTQFDLTTTTPLFYDAASSTNAAAIASGGAGLDSLDRVEIVMAIEEEFRFEIPDADVTRHDTGTAEEWNTIAGIAAYVQHRLSSVEE